MKKTTLLRKAFLAFTLCFLGAYAWGATPFTATYNFASVTTTSGTTDPTTVPTSTGITYGHFSATGVTGNSTAAGRFSLTGWGTGATNSNDTYNAGTFDDTKYYEVTITPQAGYTLDFTSITFTAQRSGTGIRNYSVRSSVDGYAANLPASINPANSKLVSQAGNIFFWAVDATTTGQTGSTITLSTGFTGISTPVTFRFYGWYAEATGGSFSIDDVTFNGNVNTSLPSISVVESTVPGICTVVGNTATSTINVSGANLQGDISLSLTGTDAAQFSISPTSVPQVGTSTPVTIIYSPSGAGTHHATLSLTSTNATTVTRELTGVTVAKPNIFISEIYGSGGNTGAIYSNDFVELYNSSSSSIDISAWSLQYYSNTGNGTATAANTFELPTGSIIPAASHFLIQYGLTGSNGAALPTPDATAPTALDLGGSCGKLILYNTNVRQTISDLASIIGNANFVDFVSYGNSLSGSGPVVPAWGSLMSSNTNATKSAGRLYPGGAGVKGASKAIAVTSYQYTGNIGNDFALADPTPTPKQTTPTGLFTTYDNLKLYTSNGKILFNAAAGETMEIFNVAGQKVASNLTTDGLNTVSVSVKGVLIVKVANRVGKVIL